MTILITSSEEYYAKGRMLTDALIANGVDVELGEPSALDVDDTFRYLARAESVILVHREPAEMLHAFIERSREQGGKTPILVWGAPECPETVVDYLLGGVKACFLEGAEPDVLIEALPVIQDGGHYLPPVVQRMLVGQFVEISQQVTVGSYGAREDPDGLTRREHEVLELLVAEHTNPEIADQLFLEVGTVKNHVHHILNKLNVPNREAAARYWQTRQRFMQH